MIERRPRGGICRPKVSVSKETISFPFSNSVPILCCLPSFSSHKVTDSFFFVHIHLIMLNVQKIVMWTKEMKEGRREWKGGIWIVSTLWRRHELAQILSVFFPCIAVSRSYLSFSSRLIVLFRGGFQSTPANKTRDWDLKWVTHISEVNIDYFHPPLFHLSLSRSESILRKYPQKWSGTSALLPSVFFSCWFVASNRY